MNLIRVSNQDATTTCESSFPSIEDWVAFTIPANSSKVVITAEPVGDAYAVQFESDETLEILFVSYE